MVTCYIATYIHMCVHVGTYNILCSVFPSIPLSFPLSLPPSLPPTLRPHLAQYRNRYWRRWSTKIPLSRQRPYFSYVAASSSALQPCYPRHRSRHFCSIIQVYYGVIICILQYYIPILYMYVALLCGYSILHILFVHVAMSTCSDSSLFYLKCLYTILHVLSYLPML